MLKRSRTTINRNEFNEDYYEHGVELGISGYSNYRWIPEITLPMCYYIIKNLGIKQKDTILDYGCAKGFLVKSFRLLGVKSWGYDISKYSISNCDKKIKRHLSNTLPKRKFSWLITKDVLEHVPKGDLNKTLKDMHCLSDNFFIVVPLGKDGKYVVPSYERDITHRIKEPLLWWIEKLGSNGYDIVKATYTFQGVKSYYTKEWGKGNGFIVAKRKKA